MQCTKEIKATVVDILEKKPGRDIKGSESIYKPVFRTSDGITITEAKYNQFVSLSTGQEIELLVNPDNYNSFLYKDNSLNVGKNCDIFLCSILVLIALEESIRCIVLMIR